MPQIARPKTGTTARLLLSVSTTPRNSAWANRAIELSYVGRTGTDSCSTVGGGGFTGCFTQMINAARAERTNNDQINWDALIEQARRQRLGQIDAAAREDEGDEHPNSGVIHQPDNSTPPN